MVRTKLPVAYPGAFSAQQIYCRWRPRTTSTPVSTSSPRFASSPSATSSSTSPSTPTSRRSTRSYRPRRSRLRRPPLSTGNSRADSCSSSSPPTRTNARQTPSGTASSRAWMTRSPLRCSCSPSKKSRRSLSQKHPPIQRTRAPSSNPAAAKRWEGAPPARRWAACQRRRLVQARLPSETRSRRTCRDSRTCCSPVKSSSANCPLIKLEPSILFLIPTQSMRRLWWLASCVPVIVKQKRKMEGHRASDLKLMAVGKRVLGKTPRNTERSRGEASEKERDSMMEDETMPFVGPCDGGRPERKFSAIEDPRVSRFSHAKIMLIEKNLLILNFLILFLGMIEAELAAGSAADSRMLLVLDLATLFLTLLTVLRKVAIYELEVDQRRVYLPRSERRSPNYVRLMLGNREYCLQLAAEVLLAAPHPSLLLQGLHYSFYSEAYSQELRYSVNDLMGVLMLLKVALIVRAIVGLSLYATPRAVRMCHYSGIAHDFVFVAKCLQQEYPLRCSGAVFTLSLLIFGYGFRVTEGQLSVLNGLPANGFEDFWNCYWAAFITMATVGYGDYVPTTSLGQMLAVALAILGVVLNSQLIMALTGYLRMRVGEARSHTVLYRLGEQEKLRRDSAAALVESVRLAQMMRRDELDPLVSRKLRPRFELLKGSIDAAKAHQKRIKSIVPSETITEEMTRSFELLKDNFKDIYTMQRKIKRKIEQMEARTDFSHDEMRRSFIDEVSNIMHKVRR